MVLVSVAMGAFAVLCAPKLFDSPPWIPLVEFLDGHLMVPGWILLTGGILGVIGLVARSRAVSVASCLVCIGWSGWIASFLWYSNFTGEPSLGSFLAVVTTLVFMLRFWLLVVVPEPGEDIGQGW